MIDYIERRQKVYRITSNCGVINGGEAVNIVPDYAELSFDIRSIYLSMVNGFVLEQYRRKGIYKLLLEEVENFLIKNNFNKVYIRTDWQELYENLGWKYLKDIVLDNGVKERLYVKNLK